MPLHSLLSIVTISMASAAVAAEPPQYDIIVYGGTSGGVIAAVQAAREGKSVVLIEPREHVGGLTVSGLGWTDTGNKSVIGGVSREFYQRCKQYYDRAEAWKFEKPGDYKTYRPEEDAIWAFEPHVAERVFNQMLRQAGVPVIFGKRLERPGGARVENGRVMALLMEDGTTFTGRVFIDATYEGDLMAEAGVSYTVGRESNEQYGETLNGVQKRRAVHHQFTHPVDPYVVAGDPSSGLLPGISSGMDLQVPPEGKVGSGDRSRDEDGSGDPSHDGEADHRVQAYNFRIAMTDVPENRIPFEKPEGYHELDHELLLRNFEAGDRRIPLSIHMVPNRKTDLNNNFAVSTDWIGMNYEFPEAGYADREAFLADLETYIRGFLWTLQNHPRVPQEIRAEAAKWGYSKDEWVDNHHWPYWCYIREARRMVSDYVQTELDCQRVRMCEDPVGMGSYNMDSHHCQRYVDENGHVRNEGDIQVSPGGPYLISYRSIVPRREECTNLLVPVCLSSSHIAYGSIRMEPVFMILGQSAATAAVMAIDAGIALQDVEYVSLRQKLLADGQVLDIPAGSTAPPGIDPKSLDGVVVDDDQAEKQGEWRPSRSVGGFVGEGYIHDNNAGQGTKSVRYVLSVRNAGRYDLRLSYSPNPNRATNVRISVRTAEGEQTTVINQRRAPDIEQAFVSLGEFELNADETVTVLVSNEGANGHVIADAVWAAPAE